MKKEPIYYNDNIVGYIEDVIQDNNGIKEMTMFFFNLPDLKNIKEQIQKSTFCSFNKNVNNDNIQDCTLYDYEVNEQFLIIKRYDD